MAEDNTQSPSIPSVVTGSIDDYLLGLADGVQKAQRQLSQMALVLQPGEPPFTYQIPRIDFELKMSLEMFGAQEGGQSQLRFKPANPSRGVGSADLSSTIRGSLVAVPSLGGKPPPSMRVSLRQIDPRKFEVTAFLFSAAGERLAGVDVQFNVDRERSQKLKAVSGGLLPVGVFEAGKYNESVFDDSQEIHPGTGFWDGQVTTDAEGIAVGVLKIDPQEQPGTRIAAVVDAIGQTETIVFLVE